MTFGFDSAVGPKVANESMMTFPASRIGPRSRIECSTLELLAVQR